MIYFDGMLQMTLLAEIRNLVQATDLDKFDNLLERREVSHPSKLLDQHKILVLIVYAQKESFKRP